MSAEQIFTLANALVVPAWLLLIFLPHHRVTRWTLHELRFQGLLAALYVALVVIFMPGSGSSITSLAGIRAAFADDWILLLGWVHYLCFDLALGAWEVRDAKARGVGHGWLVPCLLLTFIFGPAGLLAWLGVRAWKGRPPAGVVV